MSTSSRGYTLVEVLIAAALGALALTIAFGYLIPATRAAKRMAVFAQMQQTIAVALSQIRTAAATTSPAGFSWSAGDPVIALAFNPLDDIQPANAAQRWSAAFDLFWWDKSRHTLNRRLWPPGAPAPSADETSIVRGKRLTPARLAEVAAASQAPQAVKTVATEVLDFKVAPAGAEENALIQPVTVELTLLEKGYDDRPLEGRKVSGRLVFRLENQL